MHILGTMALASALCEKFGDYIETPQHEFTHSIAGHKINDPYAWLEKDYRVNDEVKSWVDKQRAFGDAFINEHFGTVRDQLKKELQDQLNSTKIINVRICTQRTFFVRREGLKDYPVYYYGENPDAPEDQWKVWLDLNQGEDHTTALQSYSTSHTGDAIVYTLANSGSDWITAHILLWNGHEFKPMEVLTGLRWTVPSFTNNEQGFLYTAWDDLGELKHTLVPKNPRLMYHKIGTPQSEDIEIFRPLNEKETGTFINGSFSYFERFFIASVTIGTSEKAKYYVASLQDGIKEGLEFHALYDSFDHEREYIGNLGNYLFFKTDNGAPRYKIVKRDVSDLKNPGPEIVVIPEGEFPMDDARLEDDGTLVVYYKKHCLTEILLFSAYTGEKIAEVPSPAGPGTLSISRMIAGHIFLMFTSYAHEFRFYRYNVWNAQITPFKHPTNVIDHDDIITEQIFVESKDKKHKLPYFVVRNKAVTGPAPTILYGYGGYAISEEPSFIRWLPLWLKRGGVFVEAVLRGGGAYGVEWHRDGMLDKKQNTFDDFITIAEHLIETNVTSRQKLGILGGSNGGLLVAACMLQRPDLFGAVCPEVGVHDMLRYHKFAGGANWVVEYGDPEKPEDFEYLYAYSPYHKALNNGPKKYPPTLIVTADTDDRVVPFHSFKLLAALQKNQADPNSPIIPLIEKNAGHSGGSTLTDYINRNSQVIAFFTNVLTSFD